MQKGDAENGRVKNPGVENMTPDCRGGKRGMIYSAVLCSSGLYAYEFFSIQLAFFVP